MQDAFCEESLFLGVVAYGLMSHSWTRLFDTFFHDEWIEDVVFLVLKWIHTPRSALSALFLVDNLLVLFIDRVRDRRF